MDGPCGFEGVSIGDHSADREQIRQMEEVQRRARIGCWTMSADRSEVTWSDEIYALIGRQRDEYEPSFAHLLETLHPEDRHLVENWDMAASAAIVSSRAEARLLGAGGKIRFVAIESWPGRLASGLLGVRGYVQDISRRKEAELALIRSEKLAILGHLTGGVAHDFNNLLTVISLNLEEAIAELSPNHELQDILVPALQAAQRGADLTNQLLAYARQAPLRPQAITMPNFFTVCRPLLQRAAGSKHVLDVQIADRMCKTMVDKIQLQTALLNLVMNARDASPDNGVIKVDADSVVLPNDRFRTLDTKPGRYAMLSVTDQGNGIPADVLPNVCTPFFTTKTGGGGSGLGLSMVDGFVRQSGGTVLIETIVDRGTTVRMFLPLENPGVEAATCTTIGRVRPQALLVDDEPAVLATVSRMFTQLGYDVRAVADATSALDEITRNPGINILFSDVVLEGGLSGIDLCHMVRSRAPHVKILLTSGFNEHTASASAVGDHAVLQKPYKRQDLYDKLSVLLPNLPQNERQLAAT